MTNPPCYDNNNIFARILRGDLPCHKIHEDDATCVIMDIMPRADGHVLVLPKAPCRNLLDAPLAALEAVARTSQMMALGVVKAFDADGVTVQQFNEEAGGQVVFHMHVHVIPRKTGVHLRPHTGQMAAGDVLGQHAQMIRAALAQR